LLAVAVIVPPAVVSTAVLSLIAADVGCFVCLFLCHLMDVHQFLLAVDAIVPADVIPADVLSIIVNLFPLLLYVACCFSKSFSEFAKILQRLMQCWCILFNKLQDSFSNFITREIVSQTSHL